jgi:hypothetical protein
VSALTDIRAVPADDQFDAGTGSVLAQLAYYAGWVSMLLIEAVLWSVLGIVVGVVGFILGGSIWGWWQAAQTTPGERLRGPILRITRHLLDTGSGIAFLGAVVLGGPPGVAAAAAASGRTDTRRLAVTASVLYALVFVAFHTMRPSSGLPMRLWPAL